MRKKAFEKYIYAKCKGKGGTKVLECLPNQQIEITRNNKSYKVDISGLPVFYQGNYSFGDILAFKSGVVKDKMLIVGTSALFVVKDGGLIENPALPYFKERFPSYIPKPKFINEIKKKYPVPDISEGFYIPTDLWYFLVRQALRRRQVLLLGASGTGKTEMVGFLVKKLRQNGVNIDLEIFDMANSNAEANFKGVLNIENGKSYFRLSRFAQVVGQENKLILLDEINRGDVLTQNILMPLLDSRRTLFVERAETPQIKVPETTFFWATANLGHSFVGAGGIDEAVAQRFVIVKIDYMPKDKEAKILQLRTGVEEEDAWKLVELANIIRKDDEMPFNPSTRNLLVSAELLADGFNFETAVLRGIYSQLVMLDVQMNDNSFEQRIRKLIKKVLYE